MAGVVFLDREQVDICIQEIEKLMGELSDFATEMDKIITQQLPEAWQGDSSNKTQQIYAEEYRPLLTTNLPESIGELSKFIDACKLAIIQTDEQLAGGGQ